MICHVDIDCREMPTIRVSQVSVRDYYLPNHSELIADNIPQSYIPLASAVKFWSTNRNQLLIVLFDFFIVVNDLLHPISTQVD